LLSTEINFRCPSCGFHHKEYKQSYLATEAGTHLFMPWYQDSKGLNFNSFVCLKCGSVHAIAPTLKGLVSKVSADDAWEVALTISALDLQKLINIYGESVLNITNLKPAVLWSLQAKGFIQLPHKLLESVQREAEDIIKTTRFLWSRNDGDFSKQSNDVQASSLPDSFHPTSQNQEHSIGVKSDRERKPLAASRGVEWNLIARSVLYAWGVTLYAALFDFLFLTLGIELPSILPGLVGWAFSGYHSYTNARAGNWLHALIAMFGFYASIIIISQLMWLARVLF